MNYGNWDWEGMDVEMQVTFRNISKIESKELVTGYWEVRNRKEPKTTA